MIVTDLPRFPIRSMRGEVPAEAPVAPTGLVDDPDDQGALFP